MDRNYRAVTRWWGDLISFLYPAFLWSLLWGHNGIFFKLYRNIKSGFDPRTRRRRHLISWLEDTTGRHIIDLDTVWKDGSFLCDVTRNSCPGAFTECQHFANVSFQHGQNLIAKYLRLQPAFTEADFLSLDLTPNLEKRLLRYLLSVRHAVRRLQSSNLSIEEEPENEIQIADEYIARGMGLITATKNHKSIFYIYSRDGSSLEDISIEIRGPHNDFGTIIVRADKSLSEESTSIPIDYRLTKEYVKVCYQPRNTGYHELSLTKDGSTIPGSPFLITVDEMTEAELSRRKYNSIEWLTEEEEEERRLKLEQKKKNSKVLCRIVDFVTEKMYLTDDGKLVKIDGDLPIPSSNVHVDNLMPPQGSTSPCSPGKRIRSPRSKRKCISPRQKIKRCEKRNTKMINAEKLKKLKSDRNINTSDASSQVGLTFYPDFFHEKCTKIVKACDFLLKHSARQRSLEILSKAGNILDNFTLQTLEKQPDDDDKDDVFLPGAGHNISIKMDTSQNHLFCSLMHDDGLNDLSTLLVENEDNEGRSFSSVQTEHVDETKRSVKQHSAKLARISYKHEGNTKSPNKRESFSSIAREYSGQTDNSPDNNSLSTPPDDILTVSIETVLPRDSKTEIIKYSLDLNRTDLSDPNGANNGHRESANGGEKLDITKSKQVHSKHDAQMNGKNIGKIIAKFENSDDIVDNDNRLRVVDFDKPPEADATVKQQKQDSPAEENGKYFVSSSLEVSTCTGYNGAHLSNKVEEEFENKETTEAKQGSLLTSELKAEKVEQNSDTSLLENTGVLRSTNGEDTIKTFELQEKSDQYKQTKSVTSLNVDSVTRGKEKLITDLGETNDLLQSNFSLVNTRRNVETEPASFTLNKQNPLKRFESFNNIVEGCEKHSDKLISEIESIKDVLGEDDETRMMEIVSEELKEDSEEIEEILLVLNNQDVLNIGVNIVENIAATPAGGQEFTDDGTNFNDKNFDKIHKNKSTYTKYGVDDVNISLKSDKHGESMSRFTDKYRFDPDSLEIQDFDNKHDNTSQNKKPELSKMSDIEEVDDEPKLLKFTLFDSFTDMLTSEKFVLHENIDKSDSKSLLVKLDEDFTFDSANTDSATNKSQCTPIIEELWITTGDIGRVNIVLNNESIIENKTGVEVSMIAKEQREQKYLTLKKNINYVIDKKKSKDGITAYEENKTAGTNSAIFDEILRTEHTIAEELFQAEPAIVEELYRAEPAIVEEFYRAIPAIVIPETVLLSASFKRLEQKGFNKSNESVENKHFSSTATQNESNEVEKVNTSYSTIFYENALGNTLSKQSEPLLEIRDTTEKLELCTLKNQNFNIRHSAKTPQKCSVKHKVSIFEEKINTQKRNMYLELNQKKNPTNNTNRKETDFYREGQKVAPEKNRYCMPHSPDGNIMENYKVNEMIKPERGVNNLTKIGSDDFYPAYKDIKTNIVCSDYEDKRLNLFKEDPLLLVGKETVCVSEISSENSVLSRGILNTAGNEVCNKSHEKHHQFCTSADQQHTPEDVPDSSCSPIVNIALPGNKTASRDYEQRSNNALLANTSVFTDERNINSVQSFRPEIAKTKSSLSETRPKCNYNRVSAIPSRIKHAYTLTSDVCKTRLLTDLNNSVNKIKCHSKHDTNDSYTKVRLLQHSGFAEVKLPTADASVNTADKQTICTTENKTIYDYKMSAEKTAPTVTKKQTECVGGDVEVGNIIQNTNEKGVKNLDIEQTTGVEEKGGYVKSEKLISNKHIVVEKSSSVEANENGLTHYKDITTSLPQMLVTNYETNKNLMIVTTASEESVVDPKSNNMFQTVYKNEKQREALQDESEDIVNETQSSFYGLHIEEEETVLASTYNLPEKQVQQTVPIIDKDNTFNMKNKKYSTSSSDKNKTDAITQQSQPVTESVTEEKNTDELVSEGIKSMKSIRKVNKHSDSNVAATDTEFVNTYSKTMYTSIYEEPPIPFTIKLQAHDTDICKTKELHNIQRKDNVENSEEKVYSDCTGNKINNMTLEDDTLILVPHVQKRSEKSVIPHSRIQNFIPEENNSKMTLRTKLDYSRDYHLNTKEEEIKDISIISRKSLCSEIISNLTDNILTDHIDETVGVNNYKASDCIETNKINTDVSVDSKSLTVKEDSLKQALSKDILRMTEETEKMVSVSAEENKTSKQENNTTIVDDTCVPHELNDRPLMKDSNLENVNFSIAANYEDDKNEYHESNKTLSDNENNECLQKEEIIEIDKSTVPDEELKITITASPGKATVTLQTFTKNVAADKQFISVVNEDNKTSKTGKIKEVTAVIDKSLPLTEEDSKTHCITSANITDMDSSTKETDEENNTSLTKEYAPPSEDCTKTTTVTEKANIPTKHDERSIPSDMTTMCTEKEPVSDTRKVTDIQNDTQITSIIEAEYNISTDQNETTVEKDYKKKHSSNHDEQDIVHKTETNMKLHDKENVSSLCKDDVSVTNKSDQPEDCTTAGQHKTNNSIELERSNMNDDKVLSSDENKTNFSIPKEACSTELNLKHFGVNDDKFTTPMNSNQIRQNDVMTSDRLDEDEEFTASMVTVDNSFVFVENTNISAKDKKCCSTVQHDEFFNLMESKTINHELLSIATSTNNTQNIDNITKLTEEHEDYTITVNESQTVLTDNETSLKEKMSCNHFNGKENLITSTEVEIMSVENETRASVDNEEHTAIVKAKVHLLPLQTHEDEVTIKTEDEKHYTVVNKDETISTDFGTHFTKKDKAISIPTHQEDNVISDETFTCAMTDNKEYDTLKNEDQAMSVESTKYVTTIVEEDIIGTDELTIPDDNKKEHIQENGNFKTGVNECEIIPVKNKITITEMECTETMNVDQTGVSHYNLGSHIILDDENCTRNKYKICSVVDNEERDTEVGDQYKITCVTQEEPDYSSVMALGDFISTKNETHVSITSETSRQDKINQNELVFSSETEKSLNANNEVITIFMNQKKQADPTKTETGTIFVVSDEENVSSMNQDVHSVSLITQTNLSVDNRESISTKNESNLSSSHTSEMNLTVDTDDKTTINQEEPTISIKTEVNDVTNDKSITTATNQIQLMFSTSTTDNEGIVIALNQDKAYISTQTVKSPIISYKESIAAISQDDFTASTKLEKNVTIDKKQAITVMSSDVITNSNETTDLLADNEGNITVTTGEDATYLNEVETSHTRDNEERTVMSSQERYPVSKESERILREDNEENITVINQDKHTVSSNAQESHKESHNKESKTADEIINPTKITTRFRTDSKENITAAMSQDWHIVSTKTATDCALDNDERTINVIKDGPTASNKTKKNFTSDDKVSITSAEQENLAVSAITEVSCTLSFEENINSISQDELLVSTQTVTKCEVKNEENVMTRNKEKLTDSANTISGFIVADGGDITKNIKEFTASNTTELGYTVAAREGKVSKLNENKLTVPIKTEPHLTNSEEESISVLNQDMIVASMTEVDIVTDTEENIVTMTADKLINSNETRTNHRKCNNESYLATDPEKHVSLIKTNEILPLKNEEYNLAKCQDELSDASKIKESISVDVKESTVAIQQDKLSILSKTEITHSLDDVECVAAKNHDKLIILNKTEAKCTAVMIQEKSTIPSQAETAVSVDNMEGIETKNQEEFINSIKTEAGLIKDNVEQSIGKCQNEDCVSNKKDNLVKDSGEEIIMAINQDIVSYQNETAADKNVTAVTQESIMVLPKPKKEPRLDNKESTAAKERQHETNCLVNDTEKTVSEVSVLLQFNSNLILENEECDSNKSEFSVTNKNEINYIPENDKSAIVTNQELPLPIEKKRQFTENDEEKTIDVLIVSAETETEIIEDYEESIEVNSQGDLTTPPQTCISLTEDSSEHGVSTNQERPLSTEMKTEFIRTDEERTMAKIQDMLIVSPKTKIEHIRNKESITAKSQLELTAPLQTEVSLKLDSKETTVSTNQEKLPISTKIKTEFIRNDEEQIMAKIKNKITVSTKAEGELMGDDKKYIEANSQYDLNVLSYNERSYTIGSREHTVSTNQKGLPISTETKTEFTGNDEVRTMSKIQDELMVSIQTDVKLKGDDEEAKNQYKLADKKQNEISCTVDDREHMSSVSINQDKFIVSTKDEAILAVDKLECITPLCPDEDKTHISAGNKYNITAVKEVTEICSNTNEKLCIIQDAQTMIWDENHRVTEVSNSMDRKSGYIESILVTNVDETFISDKNKTRYVVVDGKQDMALNSKISSLPENISDFTECEKCTSEMNKDILITISDNKINVLKDSEEFFRETDTNGLPFSTGKVTAEDKANDSNMTTYDHVTTDEKRKQTLTNTDNKIFLSSSKEYKEPETKCSSATEDKVKTESHFENHKQSLFNQEGNFPYDKILHEMVIDENMTEGSTISKVTNQCNERDTGCISLQRTENKCTSYNTKTASNISEISNIAIQDDNEFHSELVKSNSTISINEIMPITDNNSPTVTDESEAINFLLTVVEKYDTDSETIPVNSGTEPDTVEDVILAKSNDIIIKGVVDMSEESPVLTEKVSECKSDISVHDLKNVQLINIIRSDSSTDIKEYVPTTEQIHTALEKSNECIKMKTQDEQFNCAFNEKLISSLETNEPINTNITQTNFVDSTSTDKNDLMIIGKQAELMYEADISDYANTNDSIIFNNSTQIIEEFIDNKHMNEKSEIMTVTTEDIIRRGQENQMCLFDKPLDHKEKTLSLQIENSISSLECNDEDEQITSTYTSAINNLCITEYIEGATKQHIFPPSQNTADYSTVIEEHTSDNKMLVSEKLVSKTECQKTTAVSEDSDFLKSSDEIKTIPSHECVKSMVQNNLDDSLSAEGSMSSIKEDSDVAFTGKVDNFICPEQCQIVSELEHTTKLTENDRFIENIIAEINMHFDSGFIINEESHSAYKTKDENVIIENTAKSGFESLADFKQVPSTTKTNVSTTENDVLLDPNKYEHDITSEGKIKTIEIHSNDVQASLSEMFTKSTVENNDVLGTICISDNTDNADENVHHTKNLKNIPEICPKQNKFLVKDLVTEFDSSIISNQLRKTENICDNNVKLEEFDIISRDTETSNTLSLQTNILQTSENKNYNDRYKLTDNRNDQNSNCEILYKNELSETNGEDLESETININRSETSLSSAEIDIVQENVPDHSNKSTKCYTNCNQSSKIESAGNKHGSLKTNTSCEKYRIKNRIKTFEELCSSQKHDELNVKHNTLKSRKLNRLINTVHDSENETSPNNNTNSSIAVTSIISDTEKNEKLEILSECSKNVALGKICITLGSENTNAEINKLLLEDKDIVKSDPEMDTCDPHNDYSNMPTLKIRRSVFKEDKNKTKQDTNDTNNVTLDQEKGTIKCDKEFVHLEFTNDLSESTIPKNTIPHQKKVSDETEIQCNCQNEYTESEKSSLKMALLDHESEKSIIDNHSELSIVENEISSNKRKHENHDKETNFYLDSSQEMCTLNTSKSEEIPTQNEVEIMNTADDLKSANTRYENSLQHNENDKYCSLGNIDNLHTLAYSSLESKENIFSNELNENDVLHNQILKRVDECSDYVHTSGTKLNKQIELRENKVSSPEENTLCNKIKLFSELLSSNFEENLQPTVFVNKNNDTLYSEENVPQKHFEPQKCELMDFEDEKKILPELHKEQVSASVFYKNTMQNEEISSEYNTVSLGGKNFLYDDTTTDKRKCHLLHAQENVTQNQLQCEIQLQQNIQQNESERHKFNSSSNGYIANYSNETLKNSCFDNKNNVTHFEENLKSTFNENTFISSTLASADNICNCDAQKATMISETDFENLDISLSNTNCDILHSNNIGHNKNENKLNNIHLITEKDNVNKTLYKIDDNIHSKLNFNEDSTFESIHVAQIINSNVEKYSSQDYSSCINQYDECIEHQEFDDKILQELSIIDSEEHNDNLLLRKTNLEMPAINIENDVINIENEELDSSVQEELQLIENEIQEEITLNTDQFKSLINNKSTENEIKSCNDSDKILFSANKLEPKINSALADERKIKELILEESFDEEILKELEEIENENNKEDCSDIIPNHNMINEFFISSSPSEKPLLEQEILKSQGCNEINNVSFQERFQLIRSPEQVDSESILQKCEKQNVTQVKQNALTKSQTFDIESACVSTEDNKQINCFTQEKKQIHLLSRGDTYDIPNQLRTSSYEIEVSSTKDPFRIEKHHENGTMQKSVMLKKEETFDIDNMSEQTNNSHINEDDIVHNSLAKQISLTRSFTFDADKAQSENYMYNLKVNSNVTDNEECFEKNKTNYEGRFSSAMEHDEDAIKITNTEQIHIKDHTLTEKTRQHTLLKESLPNLKDNELLVNKIFIPQNSSYIYAETWEEDCIYIPRVNTHETLQNTSLGSTNPLETQTQLCLFSEDESCSSAKHNITCEKEKEDNQNSSTHTLMPSNAESEGVILTNKEISSTEEKHFSKEQIDEISWLPQEVSYISKDSSTETTITDLNTGFVFPDMNNYDYFKTKGDINTSTFKPIQYCYNTSEDLSDEFSLNSMEEKDETENSSLVTLGDINNTDSFTKPSVHNSFPNKHEESLQLFDENTSTDFGEFLSDIDSFIKTADDVQFNLWSSDTEFGSSAAIEKICLNDDIDFDSIISAPNLNEALKKLEKHLERKKDKNYLTVNDKISSQVIKENRKGTFCQDNLKNHDSHSYESNECELRMNNKHNLNVEAENISVTENLFESDLMNNDEDIQNFVHWKEQDIWNPVISTFRYPRVLSPNQSLMSVIEEKDEDQTITSSQTLDTSENLESDDYSLNSINSIVTENTSSDLKITELMDNDTLDILRRSITLQPSDMDKVNLNSSEHIVRNDSTLETKIQKHQTYHIYEKEELSKNDGDTLLQKLCEYDQAGNLEKSESILSEKLEVISQHEGNTTNSYKVSDFPENNYVHNRYIVNDKNKDESTVPTLDEYDNSEIKTHLNKNLDNMTTTKINNFNNNMYNNISDNVNIETDKPKECHDSDTTFVHRDTLHPLCSDSITYNKLSRNVKTEIQDKTDDAITITESESLMCSKAEFSTEFKLQLLNESKENLKVGKDDFQYHEYSNVDLSSREGNESLLINDTVSIDSESYLIRQQETMQHTFDNCENHFLQTLTDASDYSSIEYEISTAITERNKEQDLPEIIVISPSPVNTDSDFNNEETDPHKQFNSIEGSVECVNKSPVKTNNTCKTVNVSVAATANNSMHKCENQDTALIIEETDVDRCTAEIINICTENISKNNCNTLENDGSIFNDFDKQATDNLVTERCGSLEISTIEKTDDKSALKTSDFSHSENFTAERSDSIINTDTSEFKENMLRLTSTENEKFVKTETKDSKLGNSVAKKSEEEKKSTSALVTQWKNYWDQFISENNKEIEINQSPRKKVHLHETSETPTRKHSSNEWNKMGTASDFAERQHHEETVDKEKKQSHVIKCVSHENITRKSLNKCSELTEDKKNRSSDDVTEVEKTKLVSQWKNYWDDKITNSNNCDKYKKPAGQLKIVHKSQNENNKSGQVKQQNSEPIKFKCQKENPVTNEAVQKHEETCESKVKLNINVTERVKLFENTKTDNVNLRDYKKQHIPKTGENKIYNSEVYSEEYCMKSPEQLSKNRDRECNQDSSSDLLSLPMIRPRSYSTGHIETLPKFSNTERCVERKLSLDKEETSSATYKVDCKIQFEKAKNFFKCLENDSAGEMKKKPLHSLSNMNLSKKSSKPSFDSDSGPEVRPPRKRERFRGRRRKKKEMIQVRSAPTSDTESIKRTEENKYLKPALGGSEKNKKVSERFHVKDLFRDVSGDSDGFFRGIPHREAVIASLRSVNDLRAVSPYEADMFQLRSSKSISNIPAGYQEEYPYLPTTPVSMYRPRSALEFHLIPRSELLELNT